MEATPNTGQEIIVTMAPQSPAMTAYKLAVKALSENSDDHELAIEWFMNRIHNDHALYREIADDLMRNVAREAVQRVLKDRRKKLHDASDEEMAAARAQPAVSAPAHAVTQAAGARLLAKNAVARLISAPVAFSMKTMHDCTAKDLMSSAMKMDEQVQKNRWTARYYRGVAARLPASTPVGKVLREIDLQKIRANAEKEPT
jgi:hypothetical protein